MSRRRKGGRTRWGLVVVGLFMLLLIVSLTRGPDPCPALGSPTGAERVLETTGIGAYRRAPDGTRCELHGVVWVRDDTWNSDHRSRSKR